MHKFFNGLVVGVVATVTLTGTAYAATGGNFLLGRANSAGAQTNLKNTGTGPTLSLSAARTGQPPLAVSAGAGKATNLNADKLDGLDSSALARKSDLGAYQRRIDAQCPDGTAITVVGVDGGTRCEGTAYDSAVVEGPTSERGVAGVLCPGTGGISTSGGWVLPEGVVAIANGQSVYAEPTGEEGYIVRMVRPDGSPYVGIMTVFVQCEYPGAAVIGGALRRADGASKKPQGL